MSPTVKMSYIQRRITWHKNRIKKAAKVTQRSQIAISELEALLNTQDKEEEEDESAETWMALALEYLSEPHTAKEVHEHVTGNGWDVTLNAVRVWMTRQVGDELVRVRKGVYVQAGDEEDDEEDHEE